MRTIELRSIPIGCMLLGCFLATPIAAEDAFDERIAKARELLDSIASEYPGIAVSATVNGDIVWSDSRGFSDIEDHTPATPDTSFNVYSVAKMFSGIAAARLSEQGHLDLDEPLTSIIDSLPQQYEAITPRLLIGHLSGMAHYQSDEDWKTFSAMHCVDPSEAVGHFIERPLSSSPGQERIYSTYGYVLLSHVLSARSPQKRYTSVMRDEIFAVANMRSTKLDSVDGAPSAKATPYAGSPGDWKEIDTIDASCKFGGGGFLSSANDLALFGKAFYDQILLSPEMTEQVTQPFRLLNGESTYYGFGMDTNTFEDNGRTVQWARHSGGSPGGRAFVVVLLSERTSVGIAANADGPSLRSVAAGIAYIFADIEP